MLGNGGTTAFWDAAATCLVRERALHLSYGEFSSKFAKVTAAAPFLADPIVVESRAGRRARSRSADASADAIAWAHNETSTGVMVPVARPADAGDALVLIDATSGAGGLPLDASAGRRLLLRPAEGLRLRRRPLARPDQPGRDRADRRARRRRRTAGSRRSLSLATALENSRKDQTYNTPAVATLLLLADQVEWMLASGRPRRVRRAHDGFVEPSLRLGRRPRDYATPFVADPAKRSLVVGTIDFDEGVDAAAIAATLRANGIVDTEPYRKLGRNQLRIGMFPAIEPADVEALTACIDWVIENALTFRRRERPTAR